MAAPTRVASRLAAAADGPRPVVHASATAIYVDLDGWCLGLVSATATRVPCALWSTLPDLGVLEPVVDVRRGDLVVGDRTTRITRLVDPLVTRAGRHGAGSPERPRLGLDLGLDLPADGRLTTADLDRLLGRGPGLTPLGDDVLAGWFTTRAALGRPDDVLAAADCALRGEALPQLADWLAEPTDTTVDALLGVGATSGAGLLAGAELAITSLQDRTSPGRAA